jgi:hypothetical protein
MVPGLDDPDVLTVGAVRPGQHAKSESFVIPPLYLEFVVPPEHPPVIKGHFETKCLSFGNVQKS